MSVIFLLLLAPLSAYAWKQKSHLMISEVAIDAAASKLPEFMNGAREHLIYNAYEPDRWRAEGRSPTADRTEGRPQSRLRSIRDHRKLRTPGERISKLARREDLNRARISRR
jgi:hypothetical protein